MLRAAFYVAVLAAVAVVITLVFIIVNPKALSHDCPRQELVCSTPYGCHC